MVYSEQKMDIMFHFYCENSYGSLVIVPILASDKEHAWDIFEAMGYSDNYLLDSIIRVD